jgi:hypothetical protein
MHPKQNNTNAARPARSALEGIGSARRLQPLAFRWAPLDPGALADVSSFGVSLPPLGVAQDGAT